RSGVMRRARTAARPCRWLVAHLRAVVCSRIRQSGRPERPPDLGARLGDRVGPARRSGLVVGYDLARSTGVRCPGRLVAGDLRVLLAPLRVPLRRRRPRSGPAALVANLPGTGAKGYDPTLRERRPAGLCHTCPTGIPLGRARRERALSPSGSASHRPHRDPWRGTSAARTTTT